MNKTAPLLSEFATPTLDQWRQEVERLLKGAVYTRKMFTRTWEDIAVAPLYTEADTSDIPWRDSLPGQAPFVRGTRAGGYHEAPWLVAQEHVCPTCEEFNNSMVQALQRGQTAVNLILDHASRVGHNPDQVAAVEVGRRGTSISSLADLATALEGIDLARYPVFIQAGGAALPVAAMLVALVNRRGGEVGKLRGCLGNAPYSGLARLGCISTSVDQVYDELAVLTRWIAEHAPGMRTIPVFEGAWHGGGADLALSLGLTLAEAVAALRALEARGLDPAAIAPRFQFNLDVGTDFFMEMAKLRALRLLWSRILTASGVAPQNTGTYIHTRTARRSLTVLDPYVNMLRVTTGAMSAVLGGTDSLHVSPFDEADRLPDEFSRRIARNVQLILSHECHLEQVTDPAGGSWYVESLTRDLAEAAWAQFQAVEQAGGIAEVLASGWAQQKVAAAAAKRAEAYALRREIQVGTNKYPDSAAPPRPVESQDSQLLYRRRTEAVARQRTSASQEAHLLVLARLEKIMGCSDDLLFESAIAAAEAGATLGEFVGVMRNDAGPAPEVTPIALRRDAEPFEILRARQAAAQEQDPAAGRVFAVCLGDFAAYMPRLDFAREFFQVGGFAVSGDEYFQDSQAAVPAARASGARTVVVVGLDATYTEQAATVVRELADGPEPPFIFLAGAPGEQETALREAGLTEFIHVRSNVLDVLNSLLEKMEGRS